MTNFAFISVSDKKGLIEFSKSLLSRNYQIISMGDTQKELETHGIPTTSLDHVIPVSRDFSDSENALFLAGLLEREDSALGIDLDLIVINLFPVTTHEHDPHILEDISIGTAAVLRSASKQNEKRVVLCDSTDYKIAFEATEDPKIRQHLAIKAFRHSSEYDRLIASSLTVNDLRETGSFSIEETAQIKALNEKPLDFFLLHGKPKKSLSHDVSVAVDLISEFRRPCVSFLKHANLYGCATASSVCIAYDKTLRNEKGHAIGGVMVCNRPVTLELAKLINSGFFRAIVAPDYEKDALEYLKQKDAQNLYKALLTSVSDLDREIRAADCEKATKNRPDDAQWNDLVFAWKIIQHSEEPMVLFAKDRIVISNIVVDQEALLESLEETFQMLGDKMRGTIVASGIPILRADVIEKFKEAGITAIIQPSSKDDEIVDLCDDLKIALVYATES